MELSGSCKTAKRYALGVKINNIKKLFKMTTKEKY